MRLLLHNVSQEKPQIIFLHIGENNISVDLQNGVRVAREIISLAQELVAQSFCRRLYVGEHLFRFKGRYIQSHHQQMLFNDPVHAANAELKRHFHGNNDGFMALDLYSFCLTCNSLQCCRLANVYYINVNTSGKS